MIEALVMLGVIGAAMGSFIDALVWRLHTKKNFLSDRSECESCHHKLGILDLVPVVSWLILRGKCRYCRKPISPVVVLTEVTMAMIFVVSYLVWPYGFVGWQAVTLFALWLVSLVILGALLVYDLRWMILPDKLVFPLIALGLVMAGFYVAVTSDASVTTFVLHVLSGIGMIAGVYWLIYVLSKGKLVGYGDVKLNIFIGSVLGWQKALLVLCLANVIGFIVVLPGMLLGKLTRKSRVPFGPFLIVAFIIGVLFGDSIINWYISVSDLSSL